MSDVLRLAMGGVLLLIVTLAPLLAPWLQVVFTIALAKGLAVLGIIVLLRAGQVSFGHAMFFAASAYSAAFLSRALAGVDLAWLLVAGVACSVVFGLVVGTFVVRYRYIFFAMLNLAFSMILYSILEKFFTITGGSDGMRLPRPPFFGFALERAEFETAVFYLTLGLVLVCGWLVHRYFLSPPGQALVAIKANETRLEYLGVSPRLMLLAAYVLSAALAGLGGTLLAVIQGVVTPELAYWVRSGEFVFIAILGGAGHVAGAFAGALVYELVRTYAAAFATGIWQLILGVFLLLIILFASRGLVGLYADIMRRLPDAAVGGRQRMKRQREG